MIRRIAGLLLLLLGLVGLALAVAGIVATWQVRTEAAERADKVAARAEDLLNVAITNLRDVGNLLTKARKALDEFRDTAQTKAPEGPVPNFVQSFLLDKLRSEFAPSLGNANQTLNTALDAAVVINAVLEGADTLPLARLTSLDDGQLRELSGDLKGAIKSASKLNDLLQDKNSPSAADVSAATVEIKDGLTRAAAKVDSLAQRVVSVRERVAEVRSELSGWLFTAALGVTLFLSWFGLGQLCLLMRGGAWLFHRRAHGPMG